MKSLIIKYGVIAGLIIVAIPSIGTLMMGTGPETYQTGEIIGYSTMILSLLLIFLAVREFKQHTTQPVCFAKILKIGLGVTVIASLMFGLYNVIYATYIEPEFMDNYFNYYIENIRQSGQSEDVIAAQITQLEKDKAFFMNPLVNFSAMFFSVFIVGLIISIVSAISQSDKKSAS